MAETARITVGVLVGCIIEIFTECGRSPRIRAASLLYFERHGVPSSIVVDCAKFAAMREHVQNRSTSKIVAKRFLSHRPTVSGQGSIPGEPKFSKPDTSVAGILAQPRRKISSEVWD